MLADVTQDLPAWTDEIFGPVAPVTTFRTDEEALALANSSEYGLVGAVYSRSISRGLSVAHRIKAGMVHVNDGTLNDEATIPFGGTGMSGNGEPLRRRGEPRQLHRVAVGDGARPAADVPVLMTLSSITEVARLAGVSTATASRVVSSADYPVSPATRARVLDAARTLDYVPNALARGLLKSQIPVVAVIVHDITDPYFAEVVRGVEDAASPAGLPGHHLQLRTRRRARDVVRPAAALDARGRRDLRGERPRRPRRRTRRSRSTWPRCGARARPSSTCHRTRSVRPTSASTTRPGWRRMVAALVALGHREIAFLAGPSTLFVARARLAGYRRGLERGRDRRSTSGS